MKSDRSEDVLSMIATGNNDIDLAEVGNKTVKVASVGDFDQNGNGAIRLNVIGSTIENNEDNEFTDSFDRRY